MIPTLLNSIHSQKGAMFGIDGRIAIAIFGSLSLVAGTFGVLNIQRINAQGFADEMVKTASAVENMTRDLKGDIYRFLTTANAQNAYQALYDVTELQSSGNARSLWNGPYIDKETDTHRIYGDIRLEKFEANRTDSCAGSDICYLWLTYSTVSASMAEALDTVIDGGEETTPRSEGRLQWEIDTDPDKLWFRIGRAIN